MPALLHGHPDDWWRGHSWDAWWGWLPRSDRDELLELGWGEDLDGRGYLTHTLRGATRPVEVLLQSDAGRLRTRHTVTHYEPTDAFLVWLEEKRSVAATAPA